MRSFHREFRYLMIPREFEVQLILEESKTEKRKCYPLALSQNLNGTNISDSPDPVSLVWFWSESLPGIVANERFLLFGTDTEYICDRRVCIDWACNLTGRKRTNEVYQTCHLGKAHVSVILSNQIVSVQWKIQPMSLPTYHNWLNFKGREVNLTAKDGIILKHIVVRAGCYIRLPVYCKNYVICFIFFVP